ncbi:MAG: heme NO-binding domain-containing protein [Pseudomonadales bacterium]|nr:heme NO-binding domain-containing protein [Pseudomonadales bacterium]
MYGLVNKAVNQLVVSNFGDEAWEQILEKSGIEEDMFVSMDAYDDSITYNLVGAASEVLELPAVTILETFGEYWISYTAEQGYGAMLDMGGNTIGEFLSNLSNLHGRVAINFPALTPPRFKVEIKADNQWLVHYYSEREGLAPMMQGLLKGLGKRFNQELKIEPVEQRIHSAEHDSFLVTL